MASERPSSEGREAAVEGVAEGPTKSVDCPFGKIVEPIDVWYCKKTGRPCPIQAMVDTPHFQLFRGGCEMPRDFQERIERTILAGKWRGDEHHMPGRRLCPLCDSKSVNKRYHPLGDMVAISSLLPRADPGVTRAFRRAEVDKSLAYCAVCRPCLFRAWVRLKPALVSEGIDVGPVDAAIRDLRESMRDDVHR